MTRVAVVGIGQRARLATHVAATEGARVVACADPDPAAADRAAQLFGPGVDFRSDYRDLPSEDLDAVILTTPDDCHTEPALWFLSAGVPVLVEKPLAITTEDCDRVLAAAMAAGTRLYVAHNLRHAPVVRAMKALIEEGRIGQVKSVWCRHFVGHGGDFYFKDWHAERSRTTGLLLQKGAHDLDVIHWLAGGYCRQVVALGDLMVYGANPRRRPGDPPAGAVLSDWRDDSIWPPAALGGLNPEVDVEDLSMLLGRLDNGVLVSYQQCHFTPDYWRNYTVIGDAGRLENFGDLDGAVVRVWNTGRSGYRADADLVVDIPAGADHGGADAALVAEFLRFVRHGGPTETSPVAAREAVAAGVAATTSLRAGGRPTTVPAPAPEVVAYFGRGQT
ncbi:MAG TPA: Gfo/Idh/MocA family oxidoreductase [Acidimicrobiales bacterium]|nr:Gfo/Idh/MocA family oxidoreductase [Acidimicrobiales bacterium]